MHSYQITKYSHFTQWHVHFHTIMNNYYQFSVNYELRLEWAKHQKKNKKQTQNRNSNEQILETNSSRIKYKPERLGDADLHLEWRASKQGAGRDHQQGPWGNRETGCVKAEKIHNGIFKNKTGNIKQEQSSTKHNNGPINQIIRQSSAQKYNTITTSRSVYISS